MSSSPDELRARILENIAQKPARTRAQGRVRAAAYYVISGLAMATIFQASGGLPHASGRPASVSAPILAGEALIALAATWAVFGRGGSMTGRARGPLLIAAVAVPTAVFPWLTAWHGSYTEPFQRTGIVCMGLTLALAGVLLAAVLILRLRSNATHPGVQGAAVGAMCGAWADMVVDAWCPLTNAPHVLLGHVAPIVMLIGIGGLAGQVWLRFQAS